MAQAARLNLRMQKELKLLLTDPPPCASFPSLSDDSSASSLTSIDAHLRGPEGTVYSNGVFKIRIKIPERYPFQPPVVSFATPIYHPNIDNGGRICLDVLNLPPKGSWQPSLNISAVLTSIGLLLSEPNPDDGLMHDASREYKYNRQAFDQKARSMTEKYARAGETESATGSRDSEAYAGPSTVKIELKGSDASVCVTEHLDSQKGFSRSSSKLSLESFGSSRNCDSDETYKVPNHDYLNHFEIGRFKEAKTVVTECNRKPDKQKALRYKLSLKVLAVTNSGNGDSRNTNITNHCSSPPENQNCSTDSPNLASLAPAGNNHELSSCRDEEYMESCSISFNQEMQSLESVKVHQRSEASDGKLHQRSEASDGKLHHMAPRAVSQLESATLHEALACPLVTSHRSINPPKDAIYRIESGPTGYHLENEKENLAPTRRLLPKQSEQSVASCMVSSVVSEDDMFYSERTGNEKLVEAEKQSRVVKKWPQIPLNQLPDRNNTLKLHTENSSSHHSQFLNQRSDVRSVVKQQTNQGHDGESANKLKQSSGDSPIPEATIVLDSEDSEEENMPVRSKLSLARKCLSRKRKSNI